MADTIEEILVAELNTRLKTISVANGYNNEIKTVAIWQETFDIDLMPALNIRDMGIDYEMTSKMSGVQHDTYVMTVEIVTNSPNSKLIRSIVGDVWKAIGVDREWGCKAFDTRPVKYRKTVVQETNRIQGAILEFAIDAVSNAFSPYYEE